MARIRQFCTGLAAAGALFGAGCAAAAVAAADPGAPEGSGRNDTATSGSAGKSGVRGDRSSLTTKSRRSGTGAAARTTGRAPATPVAASRPRRASTAVPDAGAAPAQLTAAPVHVLLIGTDGTNLSKILADPANVNFFGLMEQSVTGAASIAGHTTISGPSWTTVLTGVWDSKSGVINNIFRPQPYDSWPTVFNLLEYHDPDISTAAVADWAYMTDIAEAGAYPADATYLVGQVPGDEDWSQTDALVTDITADLIGDTDPATSTFLFSYLVQVDEVGHSFGGDSPEYAEAVHRTDTNIGTIMDAVAQWEADTGADWTVLVTTDHGHQPQVGFGHGFQSPIETSTFVIADFAGDAANDGRQNLLYSNADITPTIVGLFGAPLRSDFDGVPMQSNPAVLASIVDPADLRQALDSAIGLFGYPDITTDLALSVRTVFGSIPYFINGFVNSITGQLQALADADILLVSAVAEVLKVAVQITGDIVVGATQAVATVVGYLTGAGVIPPSDPPLPPPPSAVGPAIPGQLRTV